MRQAASVPMAGADALLWTIDRDPILRSTIVALLLLDHAPPQDEVRKLIEQFTVLVPRLRCRVAAPAGGIGPPRWTPDPRFDLDQHLHRVAAPAPATVQTVLDLAQAMAGTAFDRRLPPWEALAVEAMSGGRGALVLKVHHALIDGVGGLEVLLQAAGADPGRKAVATPAADGDMQQQQQRQPGRWPVVARSPARAAGLLVHAATHPGQTAGKWRHDVATVARLLAPAPTPCSPLVRGRGLLRRFAVHDLPEASLKTAARWCGASVNDVFVAAVLQGLWRYHDAHGARASALRGLIPVNIRATGENSGGNHFVPVRVLLPAGAMTASERVDSVHRATAGAVHDPALGLSDAVAGVLSRLPAPVSIAAFGSMLKGVDFVATNLRGPTRPLTMAGAKVERIYAFSPPSGASCNVALVTTAHRACVAINVDTAAVPDHGLLVDCIVHGFDEMRRLGHEGTRTAT